MEDEEPDHVVSSFPTTHIFPLSLPSTKRNLYTDRQGIKRGTSSTELVICSSLSFSFIYSLFYLFTVFVFVAWVVGGCLACLLVLSLMGVERGRQELSRGCHHGFVLSRNGLGGGEAKRIWLIHTQLFFYLLRWVDSSYSSGQAD